MSVVWEDPPGGPTRSPRFGREPSPLRKETLEMMDALRTSPGRWARLWDMEEKESAQKRVGYITSVSQVKGQKSPFSYRLRQKDGLWSIYGQFKEQAPEPAPPQPMEDPDLVEEPEAREPTFQP